MEPAGGHVNIRKIVSGDTTLSVAEIWNAEYQERYGLLIYRDRLKTFRVICKRERINCEVLGEITGDGRVVVYDPRTKSTPVNLNLADVLGTLPQKTWTSNRKDTEFKPLRLPRNLTIAQAIEKVFRLPSVGSKGHFVNKADRSVGGRVVRQQCCGIAQITIADCGVLATGFLDKTGVVESIGVQPIIMLIDPEAGARMAHAEMLTNMAGVKIDSIKKIRTQINWMGAAKLPGQGAQIYDAAVAGSDFMISRGYAQNGGKDSTSLAANVQGELVRSPNTMVVKGYAAVRDITKIVTPDIKRPGSSLLGLIDLGRGKNRLGGSALAQVHNQIGNTPPDCDSQELMGNAFRAVQEMVDSGLILALHDRSGGGLITTVAEMCMASNCGFDIRVKSAKTALAELFCQELGWVVEFLGYMNPGQILEICQKFNVPFDVIGSTSHNVTCQIEAGDRSLFKASIVKLRRWWERTSFELEKIHRNPACAKEEYAGHGLGLSLLKDIRLSHRLTFTPTPTPAAIMQSVWKPRVAVLREEGTNGDDEMRAAFLAAGFEVHDIPMSDLLLGKVKSFAKFQGLVFPGGFSYMDTFGSGRGWAATILFNERLKKMFADFFSRPDTFSFGVCNGFQFQTLMGWFPWEGVTDSKQPRLEMNTSGAFESRWVQVEIRPSPSIVFRGMEGSRFGMWVDHGEGRLVFPNKSIARMVEEQHLAPLVYIDPDGKPTERYPYNPNGSAGGIAGLCSPDGRHLGKMPHSERSFLLSRLPWMPAEWKDTLTAAPSFRMYQNTREWCEEHRR
jgi:phosphoribosylformylglycinamidine synthase